MQLLKVNVAEERYERRFKSNKDQTKYPDDIYQTVGTVSFQDITIKQLIQECQINRSTFYRNYEDKYDLIQKIADELLVQFQKAIKSGIYSFKWKKRELYFVFFANPSFF